MQPLTVREEIDVGTGLPSVHERCYKGQMLFFADRVSTLLDNAAIIGSSGVVTRDGIFAVLSFEKEVGVVQRKLSVELQKGEALTLYQLNYVLTIDDRCGRGGVAKEKLIYIAVHHGIDGDPIAYICLGDLFLNVVKELRHWYDISKQSTSKVKIAVSNASFTFSYTERDDGTE